MGDKRILLNKIRTNSNSIINSNLISLLLVILLLVILSSIVIATSTKIRPTAYNDVNNFVSNESHSYDEDNSTYSTLISGNNSFELFSFGTGSHPDSEEIINVTLSFTLNSSSFNNDLWNLKFSNNSGSSTSILKTNSSDNISSQTFNYDIDNGGTWLWSEIATNLRAYLNTFNISNDNAIILLFDVFATVIYDGSGPEINLSLPLDNTSYSKTTLVNFTFNVSDDFNGIENCSLVIDENIYLTNNSITQKNNIFSYSLSNGAYSWKIICYDNSSNYNYEESFSRNLYVDSEPPTIELLSPSNTSTWEYNVVHFNFNVSDVSDMSECSLYINDSLNQTKDYSDLNWPTGVDSISTYLEDGNYSWFINCTDIYGRSNKSNSWNLTVDSNKKPFFNKIEINPYTNLVLGNNVIVYCNGTVTDLDGASTISEVNAYLHREDVSYNSSDLAGIHYTSSVCNEVGLNATSKKYDCQFSLPYYSASMNWRCTFTAKDSKDYIGVDYNTTFINPLYSFNLTPSYVSYGAIEAGNISEEQSITVSNLGNSEIDLSLTGYAVTEKDNLALNCTVGSTPLSNERYSIIQGTSFNSMTSLVNSTSPPQLDSFNLPPKNATFNGEKNIYWRIKLGVPQKGDCDGYLTFIAVQS